MIYIDNKNVFKFTSKKQQKIESITKYKTITIILIINKQIKIIFNKFFKIIISFIQK